MFIYRHSAPTHHDKAPYQSICQVIKKPVTYYLQQSVNDELPKWLLLDEVVDKDIINKALDGIKSQKEE